MQKPLINTKSLYTYIRLIYSSFCCASGQLKNHKRRKYHSAYSLCENLRKQKEYNKNI